MDVIIVCHTEPGYVYAKKQLIFDHSKQNVKEAVLSLAKLADDFGAKITFALMPGAAKRFPEQVGHEVGLHIHPGWTRVVHPGIPSHWIGDMYLKDHCAPSINSWTLRDYTYKEQLDLIKAGRDHLADLLGTDPEVFVAACWSTNNDTVKALTHSGMTHDCSAFAGADQKYADWSRLPRICMPYHPSELDYQERGNLRLLVVPVSEMLMGADANPEMAPYLGASWLRACFKEYFSQNLPLFHICLHSLSMTDPYYRSTMREFLRFISTHHVTFKFASEIEQYDLVDPRTKISPYLRYVNTTALNTALRSRFRKNA